MKKIGMTLLTAALLAVLCTACNAVTPGPVTTRNMADQAAAGESGTDRAAEETEEAEATASGEDMEETQAPEETVEETAAEETETTTTNAVIENAGDGGETVYVTSAVNVRDAASKNSNVIGTLYQGQSVKKIGEDNGWVMIEYNGEVGYVYSGYLSDSE